MDYIWQVRAPTFTAALIISDGGLIRKASPVLLRWEGKTFAALERWCRATGFRLVYEGPDPTPLVPLTSPPSG